MNREDIIRMARDAGASHGGPLVMGLTPLTRRRLADAWAGVILLVVFSGSAFITGYGLGYTQRRSAQPANG